MQLHPMPSTGFVRQAQLIGDPKAEPPIPAILPIGASTLWRWVNAGTFPKPIKLSARVTAWRCEDVRCWAEQQRAVGDKAAA
jgi:predicted DNA-binding transcriptional regulator AlpA